MVVADAFFFGSFGTMVLTLLVHGLVVFFSCFVDFRLDFECFLWGRRGLLQG